MARITHNKLDRLATAASRLQLDIHRMLVSVDGMLANPRAKYGRTCQLLSTARSELHECRSTLGQVDRALAADRPRSVADSWPTVGLVAELLTQASSAAEQAAITLRVASETLSD